VWHGDEKSVFLRISADSHMKRLFAYECVTALLRVKMSLCLVNYSPRHEDIWGSGYIFPPFLTAALDEGDWLATRPSRFTPEEIPLYALDRWLGGPQNRP
jgi:hypothetical protein